MDVSIIFVNYKTKDLTINAINSVIEKTKDINYEIFVVDNNSQDGSIEAIEEKFPNINIIKNSVNSGFGAANNIAIKQSKGKYILCLNTDTLLVNNAIKIMFDFMEKEENQNVGICGGYLVDGEGKPCIMGGQLPTVQEVLLKFDFLKLLKPLHKKYQIIFKSDEAVNCKTINSIIGADIFFRKSCLDKVGIFDEKFFMFREETDLCKRIIDNNYLVKYVPEAKIIHLEGKSINNQLQKSKWFKKSIFYYFEKHNPKSLWLIKLSYLILYFLDWIILKNKNSKELFFFIIRGCKD